MLALGLGRSDAVAAAGNTFSSEWGDVAASGQERGLTWKVSMAPGQEDFNGQITEYLKTEMTASYCEGGYLYETTLAKVEQATDLKGVQIQALKGAATVNRKTTLPGTQSKTASSDCVTSSGDRISQPVSTEIVLRGSWSRSAAAVQYTGSDCGGTGRCTYFDAKVRGPVGYQRQNLDMAAGSKAWLWHGTWDLSA